MQFAPTRVPGRLPSLGRGRPYMGTWPNFPASAEAAPAGAVPDDFGARLVLQIERLGLRLHTAACLPSGVHAVHGSYHDVQQLAGRAVVLAHVLTEVGLLVGEGHDVVQSVHLVVELHAVRKAAADLFFRDVFAVTDVVSLTFVGDRVIHGQPDRLQGGELHVGDPSAIDLLQRVGGGADPYVCDLLTCSIDDHSVLSVFGSV